MSANRSSLDRGSERLAARRRLREKRISQALLVLVLIIFGAALWGLWQPQVRVHAIRIVGYDSSLASAVEESIAGSYLGIIPRNSIFFLAEHAIRVRILGLDARIASVSISRDSFTGITVTIDERAAIAKWCGAAQIKESSTTPAASCYLFDANGYIFSLASTSDSIVTPFTLYAPLEGSATDPVRAFIEDRDSLPKIFDFARQVGTLGSSVSTITIRADEVDDLVATSTRVTYVLGQEFQALSALTSAKDKLDFTNGTIEYVDLRFPGKVYVKRVATTTTEKK